MTSVGLSLNLFFKWMKSSGSCFSYKIGYLKKDENLAKHSKHKTKLFFNFLLFLCNIWPNLGWTKLPVSCCEVCNKFFKKLQMPLLLLEPNPELELDQKWTSSATLVVTIYSSPSSISHTFVWPWLMLAVALLGIKWSFKSEDKSAIKDKIIMETTYFTFPTVVGGANFVGERFVVEGCTPC